MNQYQVLAAGANLLQGPRVHQHHTWALKICQATRLEGAEVRVLEILEGGCLVLPQQHGWVLVRTSQTWTDAEQTWRANLQRCHRFSQPSSHKLCQAACVPPHKHCRVLLQTRKATNQFQYLLRYSPFPQLFPRNHLEMAFVLGRNLQISSMLANMRVKYLHLCFKMKPTSFHAQITWSHRVISTRK